MAHEKETLDEGLNISRGAAALLILPPFMLRAQPAVRDVAL
jgi:hypothetical protein